MLVLTRHAKNVKRNKSAPVVPESQVVVTMAGGEQVVFTVLDSYPGRARVGVKAPETAKIRRGELSEV